MADTGPRRAVMVELRVPPVTAPLAALDLGASLPGFIRDPAFDPVPVTAGDGGGAAVVIRGTVDTEAAIEAIQQRPEVLQVWADGPVDHFTPDARPPG